MRQLKFVRSAAATVIAAAIMTSAADVWAQDKKCKDHFHIGVATARTLSGAQQAAIRRWKFQATRHDGPNWDNFKIACNKLQACPRVPRGFHCTMRGNPGTIK
jgi:hypothetical protein